MRITTAAKAETEQRILETAARLFAGAGWDETTTREIAAQSGIATGTLFNYFETKEAIAAALIDAALSRAGEQFESRAREYASLEEALFAFIWSGLKSLRPYRGFLGGACETLFSPVALSSTRRPGDEIRTSHLEAVERIAAQHRIAGALTAVPLQLYWTLFLGVLAFWSADGSRHQEDTLALLDQSLHLFAAALTKKTKESK